MFYIAICDDDKKSVSILKEKMSLVLKKIILLLIFPYIRRAKYYSMIFKRGNILI